MQLVLVATDFTDTSRRAEERALLLARATRARVHLLHVVEPIDDPEDTDEETREFHRTLEEKASERLKECATRFAGLEVSYSVVLGHRHQCIVRAADEQQVDLVVLGTHPLDEGDSPRVSISQRVTFFCRRPVMLVP